MRSEHHSRKKNSHKKRIAFSIITVILLAIASYAVYIGVSAGRFLQDIQGEDLPETELNANEEIVLTDRDPFSVLLLGVDLRPGDIGRSDTIIVATVNPEEESVKLLSIPRDTLITLPETGELDKINASYAYGGVPLTVETVENYLSIPIHYYAQINMQGMVDLVDAVGGIDVDSPLEFTVQDSEENMDAIHIEEGPQHLDGEQALGYARMRKQDPAGDWGRQERQREVVTEIIDETLSISSLANFNRIFTAIGPNIETNFSGSDLWSLATNYANTARNIEILTLDGEAADYYFPSYGQEVYTWVPYEETLGEIIQEMQEHLELSSSEIEEVEDPDHSPSVFSEDEE